MFNKLNGVEERYGQLEALLSDPSVLQDRDAYQQYAREHAELTEIVSAYRTYKSIDQELDESLEFLKTMIRKLSIWPKRRLSD
jgi:peptide chain release factor 1